MCDADLMGERKHHAVIQAGSRNCICGLPEGDDVAHYPKAGAYRPPDPALAEKPPRLESLHVQETRYVLPPVAGDFYPERRPSPRAARYQITLTTSDGTKHEFDTFGSADFVHTFESQDEIA